MGRPKLPPRPCSIKGCPGQDKARGWCKTHWARWKKHGSPNIVVTPQRTDVLDRILRRVNKDGPLPENNPNLGPCWIFGGCLNRTGYGQVTVSFEEGRALVHRVVYQRLVGTIPEGLHLDHLCRTPACCRPEHLEPVTPAENNRRGVGAAVQRARFAAMQYCVNGHPRTAGNLVLLKSGKKRCRPCVNAWAAEARARQRAAR